MACGCRQTLKRKIWRQSRGQFGNLQSRRMILWSLAGSRKLPTVLPERQQCIHTKGVTGTPERLVTGRAVVTSLVIPLDWGRTEKKKKSPLRLIQSQLMAQPILWRSNWTYISTVDSGFKHLTEFCSTDHWDSVLGSTLTLRGNAGHHVTTFVAASIFFHCEI